MNERIQQLAEQAGLNYHNWITKESNVNNGDFKYPRLEDYENFAELIVQECIDIIAPYTVRMSRPGEEYLHPILEIKQHFGVEE